MIKNKLLLLVFLFPFIGQAAITAEQFLALSDQEKLHFHCQQRDIYQRILTNKDAAIFELENKVNWWKNVTVGTVCIAAGTTLVAASIIARKVFRE